MPLKDGVSLARDKEWHRMVPKTNGGRITVKEKTIHLTFARLTVFRGAAAIDAGATSWGI